MRDELNQALDDVLRSVDRDEVAFLPLTSSRAQIRTAATTVDVPGSTGPCRDRLAQRIVISGTSPAWPNTTFQGEAPLDGLTYQVPVEARYTAASVFRSPS